MVCMAGMDDDIVVLTQYAGQVGSSSESFIRAHLVDVNTGALIDAVIPWITISERFRSQAKVGEQFFLEFKFDPTARIYQPSYGRWPPADWTEDKIARGQELFQCAMRKHVAWKQANTSTSVPKTQSTHVPDGVVASASPKHESNA